MDVEKVASCCLGVRIYCRKAELFHLLSIQMMKSSMSAPAAVVATPIWKQIEILRVQQPAMLLWYAVWK